MTATMPSVMDAIKKIPTSLPGVLILEPSVFGDQRGFFLESYSEKVFAELGIRERFVQDNHSFSTRNVLRGLSLPDPACTGETGARLTDGEILDVAGGVCAEVLQHSASQKPRGFPEKTSE